jgi:hypothetical protein
METLCWKLQIRRVVIVLITGLATDFPGHVPTRLINARHVQCGWRLKEWNTRSSNYFHEYSRSICIDLKIRSERRINILHHSSAMSCERVVLFLSSMTVPS